MATVPPAPTYWQAPQPWNPESQVLARLRARLVGVVAALVLQATIALLGVLPKFPGVTDAGGTFDAYATASQPVSFWIQFAVLELLAAIVVSLAFGPAVRLGDVPAIGRLVLGAAFVMVPAAAIVLGEIEAAHTALYYGPAGPASSWLGAAFSATLFFGLPLIAMRIPAPRAG